LEKHERQEPRKRAAAPRRKHHPRIEPLEERALLAGVGNTLNGVESALFNGKLASFLPTEIQGALAVTAIPISVKVGEPFSGTAASFPDLNSSDNAGNLQAVISWGDGHSSIGQIQAVSPGFFQVVGQNKYDVAGMYNISVTVVAPSGESGSATSTALVVNSPFVFTGQLDALSNTGPPGSQGFTRSSQPTFTGTAEPFAIVRLFAQRSDQDAPVPLGQAPANAEGQWSLAVGPLADGRYAMSAQVIDPNGIPGPMVLFNPGSPLVIDTVAPQVVGVSFGPGLRSIIVVYRDNLSGMNIASILNPANYQLVSRPLRGGPPALVTHLMTSSLLPTDPQAVALSIPGNPRFRASLRNLRIIAGGVTDMAGNPLAAPGPIQPALSFVVKIPSSTRGKLHG